MADERGRFFKIQLYTLQQNKIPFLIWTICSKHSCFGDKHKEIFNDLTSLTRVWKKSPCKELEQLDSSCSSSSKHWTVDGKIKNNEVIFAEII